MKTIFIIMTLIMSSASFSAEKKTSSTQKETHIASSSEKKWNISTSPIGILFGSLNVTLDYALNDKSTIGGTFATYTYSSSVTSIGLGANYNYWLSDHKVYTDSWVINANLQFASARNSAGSSVSGLSLSGMALYNWFWPSGFNLNVGGGLGYLTLDLGSLGYSRVSGFLPALGFNIGYVF